MKRFIAAIAISIALFSSLHVFAEWPNPCAGWAFIAPN